MLFLLKDDLLAGKAFIIPSSIFVNNVNLQQYYTVDFSNLKNVFGAKNLYLDSKQININLLNETDFLKSIIFTAFPNINGIHLKTLKKIIRDNEDSLKRYQHVIKKIMINQINDPEFTFNRIIQEELEYEFAKLNQLYMDITRKLRWGGIDCGLGIIAFGLSLVVPEIYQKLFTGLIGVKSISSGIKFILENLKPKKQLRSASDFWLPWYIKNI